MTQKELFFEGTNSLEALFLEAEKLKRNSRGISVPELLSNQEIQYLDTIIETCEGRKAVLTVILTLLSYKSIIPNQDIRKHQANMKEGFSGRTYDTQVITPFMKEKKFPAMRESGWLTRSLEQNKPYNLDYSGKITPKKTKEAFLKLLEFIEGEKASPKDYLIYLFQKLIIYREEHTISLAIPPLTEKAVSIEKIILIINSHFNSCSEVGKSRLPVLAIYSVYECIIDELNRYRGKVLQKLKSHTSADARSKEIGDIVILSEDNTPFEAVEVKYGKPITSETIQDSYEKFKIYPVNRYYLLSTVNPTEAESIKIKQSISKISEEHGCQVIANGVLETIKYYLRLISDTNQFIQRYVDQVKKDDVIKLEHKKVWNQIIKKLI